MEIRDIQWNTSCFLQKLMVFLNFGSCQNCVSSANLAAGIQLKHSNKIMLGTGKPYTYEYVTLLHSFHRDPLSKEVGISYVLFCTGKN